MIIDKKNSSLDWISDFLKTDNFDAFIKDLFKLELDYVFLAFSIKNKKLFYFEESPENNDLIFIEKLYLPIDYYVVQSEGYNGKYTKNIKVSIFNIIKHKLKNYDIIEIIEYDRDAEFKKAKSKISDLYNESILDVSTCLINDDINRLFKMINTNNLDISIFTDEQIFKFYLSGKLSIDLPEESIKYVISNNNIFKLIDFNVIHYESFLKFMEYIKNLSNDSLFEQLIVFIKELFGNNKLIQNKFINDLLSVLINKYVCLIKGNKENEYILTSLIKEYSLYEVNNNLNNIFDEHFKYLLLETSVVLNTDIFAADSILNYLCNPYHNTIYKDVTIDIDAMQYINLFMNDDDQILNINKFFISKEVMNDLLKLNDIYDSLVLMSENKEYSSKKSILMSSKSIKAILNKANIKTEES